MSEETNDQQVFDSTAALLWQDWPGTELKLREEIAELQSKYDAMVLERDGAALERDALAGTDFVVALREMTEHRDRLLERNNELVVQRDRANDRLEHQAESFQAFKDKVVEAASKAAEEHGWCEVVDNILEDLGLERPTVTYAGTMTITVQFHAELGKGKRALPSVSWVRDSISWSDIESTIENGIEFDSDHTDGEVDDVSFVITNIRAYDE